MHLSKFSFIAFFQEFSKFIFIPTEKGQKSTFNSFKYKQINFEDC